MAPPTVGKPSWDRLFDTAVAQSGYVTTKQAAEAGYSTHLLRKHILAGRIQHPQRGIYRLVHFPAGEHEELVTAWLWSEQAGVMSHQTALSLHQLSDILPSQVHLTLPPSWRHRRLRVPPGVVLHHARAQRPSPAALHAPHAPDAPHAPHATDVALAADEPAWFGPVPATNARQTLADCATSGLSPELLRQAAQEALRRGLVTEVELPEVEAALAPFGGLAG